MGSLDELRGWDAVETAERLRRADVSPREVIDAALARADEVAHLGAIVTPTPERARAQAGRLSDAPFAGVPTYIKDLSQLQGVRTTWGSRGAGAYVSKRTDPNVRRFEELGFVSLGKSATPEFGLTATTEPLGRPPCRNPWGVTRSAGGSSGGAAVLVSTGVVPLAHASDGGGSIRIPAANCGLVGLKPSRFRFDMEGSTLLPVNIAVDGVVSRTVRDTVAFYAGLERARPPRGVAPVGAVRPEPPSGLRVGVFTEPPRRTPVHPEHRAAALDAGKLLASMGHHVDELPCPFEPDVMEDFLGYWSFVAWMQLSGARVVMHWGFDTTQVEPWSTSMAREFAARRLQILASLQRLRAFAARSAQVLARWDVIVCPTTGGPAPVLGELSSTAPFAQATERLKEFAAFTPLQNASGSPALSLPWGLSSAGVPVGVQLSAAHGRDALLLELAQAVEAARPWQRLAPPARWAEART